MSRSLFCLVSIAWMSLPAVMLFAQPAQEFRMEIAGKASDRPYDIIALGTEGLALVRDLQKYDHGNKKWQVNLLDTVLTKTWSTELDLDSRLELVGFEHLPGSLYLLFRETQTTYYNFNLILLNLTDHTVQTDKIRFDLNFRLTHFTVAGTTALFGGYINSEPAILLFNHSSDKPKVLPGLFTQNISLLDLRVNVNSSFNVLILEDRRANSQRLILRTFDASGNLLVDDLLEIDPKYKVLSGMTSRLHFDDMVIVGTYGEGNGSEVLGFYSLKVDPFGTQVVTYTDLPSISHFLDYLPEEKARKALAKAVREKKDGQIPRYKANLLPIRLEEIGEHYYVFAETFHPPSNVNYYPYGSPNWNYNYGGPFGPGNPNRSPGYESQNYPEVRNSEVRMIQSLVLRYPSATSTPDGVTLKYEEVKRPVLDQTGDFLICNDSVMLAYKHKTDVVYLSESEDIQSRPEPKKVSIRLKQESDVLKEDDEEAGGLRHWYGTRFYLWGYRRIKTTLNDEVESRYVFYVNRLDF